MRVQEYEDEDEDEEPSLWTRVRSLLLSLSLQLYHRMMKIREQLLKAVRTLGDTADAVRHNSIFNKDAFLESEGIFRGLWFVQSSSIRFPTSSILIFLVPVSCMTQQMNRDTNKKINKRNKWDVWKMTISCWFIPLKPVQKLVHQLLMADKGSVILLIMINCIHKLTESSVN